MTVTTTYEVCCRFKGSAESFEFGTQKQAEAFAEFAVAQDDFCAVRVVITREFSQE